MHARSVNAERYAYIQAVRAERFNQAVLSNQPIASVEYSKNVWDSKRASK